MGTISRRVQAALRFLPAHAFVVLLALAPSSAAAVDFTGTWSGPFQALFDCDGTPTLSSGSATLHLLQSEAALSGTATLNFANIGCEGVGQPLTLVASLHGTVAENGFSATLAAPGLGFGYVGAELEGEVLTIGMVAGDVRLAGTMTRMSNSIPPSNLTGAYSGNYSMVENVAYFCSNMTTLVSSGPMTANVLQAGNAVSGQLILQGLRDARPDSQGICTVVDESDPQPAFFSGTISGETISGFAGDADGEPEPFTGTIGPATIVGRAGSQGDGMEFALTRTSAVPAPVILRFEAQPANIQPGKSATLAWATSNAGVVWLDQGIGARPTTGSVRVSPSETTQYTLMAKSAGRTVSARTTVTVTPAAALVILSAHPGGMLQRAGFEGATDTYTLTNIGGAPSSIALTQTGSFFTQSPVSFTLAPGASQTVTITALAQPAGVYEGTSAIAGDGVRGGAAVRVILLSAASPTGAVDPRPETRRKELSAPAGEDPTGSLSFTNRGAAAVEAIAVSDAEWLVPQKGRISIAPGATASVAFTIRRSLRPDGALPAGAVKARFGLLFFGSPSAGSGKVATATTPVSKSLVTVVDLVKPGIVAGTPPPLLSGELALFVAGMSSHAGATGDLLLSTGDEPVSDLRIYYAASGGTPSFLEGKVAGLAANAGIALPGLVKNVFEKNSQTGTVQLRSASIREIAMSGIASDTRAGSSAVATVLPLFRSDRGADAGGEILLAGVEQSAAATTTLLIQEMTGSAGTVQVDAFGSAGETVGTSRTETVGAFGLLELEGAVPPGASTIRVRNASTGTARIAAAAMVTDASSGDVWTVVDPVAGLPLDEPLFVPLLGGLQRADGAQTELLFVNGGPASATVELARHTSRPRRRPIHARGFGEPSHSSTPAAALETLTAEPYRVVSSTSADGTAGYGVITAARSIRTVARLEFDPAAGSGRVGSSLPALPASSALRLGESKRFPGIEDASQATAAAKTPATYSSDLVLIETAGGETGVRVMVRTRYAVSTTLTSDIVAATDVTLPANGVFILRDVVGTVMGAQRTRYGDLNDVTVDVEVVSGTGGVLPFIQSIDNASHDVIVRAN